MKKKLVIEKIEKSKYLLPLSFYELLYKKNEKNIDFKKIIHSEKYNDKSYEIFKFYKPISRLK